MMNVGFFKSASDVFLEAEVNPASAARFESDYHTAAGEAPALGAGYQHQPNKWGVELRVYFNCDTQVLDDLAAAGISFEEGSRPYKSSRQYRTNVQDFFWALVRTGYRLGEN